MKKRMALVFLYEAENRLSLNVLAGALETYDYFVDLPIFFIKTKSELITRLPEIIRDYAKVVLGISFATTQLWDIAQLMIRIRENFGHDLFCIAGGPHPTGDPRGTLALGFDLVVRGEGEEVLPDVLRTMDEDQEPRRLKGVAFIDEQGEYVFNGRRPPLDLDKFSPFSIKHDRFGPLEITRGCPFACYFCQTAHIFPGKVRHRSIGKILELAQIMKRRKSSGYPVYYPECLCLRFSRRKAGESWGFDRTICKAERRHGQRRQNFPWYLSFRSSTRVLSAGKHWRSS